MRTERELTEAEVDAAARTKLPDPAAAFRAAQRKPVECSVLVQTTLRTVGDFPTTIPASPEAREVRYRLAFFDGSPGTPSDAVQVRPASPGRIALWARWERVP